MVTFEELASYISYYGGSSYEELDELERGYYEGYKACRDERFLRKAQDFGLIKQMILDGIEFVKHVTSDGIYYEPRAGWDILHEYVNKDYLYH